MNVRKIVMDKILLMPGASPEVKEELAALAQDAVEADDPFLLMGPLYVFHEGHGDDNQEYVTEEATYELVKKYGILSLVARILEARAVAWDRLWELAKKHAEAPFEMQEAVVLRGNHAILEWDATALEDSVMTWHLEGQEVTCGLSPKEAKKICDDWGVTALVKELIG